MIDLSNNATYVSIVVHHDNRRYLVEKEVQIDHVSIIIIFLVSLGMNSSIAYLLSTHWTKKETADFCSQTYVQLDDAL